VIDGFLVHLVPDHWPTGRLANGARQLLTGGCIVSIVNLPTVRQPRYRLTASSYSLYRLVQQPLQARPTASTSSSNSLYKLALQPLQAHPSYLSLPNYLTSAVPFRLSHPCCPIPAVSSLLFYSGGLIPLYYSDCLIPPQCGTPTKMSKQMAYTKARASLSPRMYFKTFSDLSSSKFNTQRTPQKSNQISFIVPPNG
jgi:hypothetical protein